MKKLLFLAIGLTLITFMGCKEDRKVADVAGFSQNDSLQKIIAQKDNEINDIMETFNQIEAGFKEINEAENRVSLMKDGEGANRRQQLVENVQFSRLGLTVSAKLAHAVHRNRLRRQLRESSVKSDNLKKTIENLVAELEEKDNQLQQLRAELDAKNIHIAELDQTISGLNDNVTNLQTESSQKSATIQAQDKQLNTAWFVFGTKKELKEQRIIDGDRVLESNFNKSYFTKIDIRVEKEIKLYSKYAKILTMHPSDSYTLEKDANKQYVLRIPNPQIFWSTSKYLVILVK